MEQHKVNRILYDEDLLNYDVTLDLVSNLHNQVLELVSIDPPRRWGSRRGKRPNVAHEELRGMYA